MDEKAPVRPEITTLLHGAGGSGSVEWGALYEAVYAELRSIAARKMASERPDHTLQPTALVNEAYLRLANSDGEPWKNRAHFFAAAAESMRRILVDSARRKRQQKRGGNDERVELGDALIVAPMADEKLMLVHEALDTLAREDPVKADIVKLRYFVGLNHLEIAAAFNLSEKTVQRHWAAAKLRLYAIITEDRGIPSADAIDRG